EHCTIAATGTPLPQPPSDNEGIPIGHIPLMPAIAGYASDLLVLGTGVYSYQPAAAPAWVQVYKAPVTLTAVASGDLDGDGAIDAALIAGGPADFDVLYREPGAAPAFVVAPIQTAGVVGLATIADFDGNGAADVAYTEQLLDHEQLSVAF